MLFFSPLVAFLLALQASAQERPLAVGYYPSWGKAAYPHTTVQYGSLTHIAHAFIFPNADGTIDMSGFTLYPELIQSSHQHGVGMMISVGGWDEVRTPRFSQMVKDSVARRRFVSNLKEFCLQYSYDGADIDWEYPVASDKPFSMQFFQELHDTFATVSPRLLLSIAAPSTDWNNGYDWTVMTSVLDWVGVMTYDFYGSWTSKAGPNAPLYGTTSTTDQGWIDNSVSFYLNQKHVPPSMLLTGVPFYGWQFNASAMFGPSSGASQLPYNQIAPLAEAGWTRYWDSTTRVPHLINPSQDRVISYDDTASISEKCAYVRSHGLGGVIIWALGQDYLNNDQVLLSTVGIGLSGTSGILRQLTQAVPESIALFQNFPNPFNGETRIRFAVRRPGHVSLTIYDLLGRKVLAPVDRNFSRGTYEVSIRSQELGSGVFFYRLAGQDGLLTRRMIVLP